MTRFARSKGSKSSNERIPEQATPWEIMRKQLDDQQNNKEDSSKRAEFEAIRKENYDKFLKEETEKKTVKTWCEFPEDPTKVQKAKETSKNVNEITKKKKKNKKFFQESTDENADIEMGDSEKSLDVDDPELSKWCDEGSDQESSDRYKQLTSQLEDLCQKEIDKTPKKKKQAPISNPKPGKKGKNLNSESIKDVDKPADLPNITGKNKNKKKKRQASELAESYPTPITTEETIKKFKKQKMEAEIIPEETNPTSSGNKYKNAKETKSEVTASQIRNPKEPKLKAETIPSDNVVLGVKKQKQKLVFMNAEGVVKLSKTQKRNLLRRKQAEKAKKELKKEVCANVSTADMNEATRNPNLIESDLPIKKKEHARRKELPENLVILNGEEVEIVTLHGFPITAKDGERIQELRKSLISKGIPRSEVERTIKLERRKAEKSLARLKKNMCFHCRKGGHILAECPELNKDGSKSSLPSSGLCFKCGSTEHTHFACKVVRTQDYKFASCFICKEQGHISRQCPDNPKGIYPKGGACRVCGDVTHLKKDCPQILQQREDDTIRLETLQSENVEDMGEAPTPAVVPTAPAIKRVKF